MRYAICEFETNRYSGGIRVYDQATGFYDGKVADFDGDSQHVREQAQALADKLNGVDAALDPTPLSL